MTMTMTEHGPVTDKLGDMCVHQLVEIRATTDPDRVAVVCGDQVLTYGELSRRTNRLAHHLSRFGLRQPSIGILLPRSVEFVVAALAVLKAGGSYVPLDADYPVSRLHAMLTAAQCPVVISATPLLGHLPGNCDARTVCMDTLAGQLAGLPDTDLAVPVHPDTLAYTMFTSGSTGIPKGVMITHRGVVRLVRPPGIVRMHRDDVLLHVSSVSFDAATFDIWGALANGAQLVVAPAGRTSVMDIGTLIRKHQVTTALLPTGLFHLMVDERLADLTRLRKLVAGGDVLSAQHAKRFVAAAPGCTLVNAYGPTEVTVATTTHHVLPDKDDPDQADKNTMPIGQAMPRTNVRLLDRELRPVLLGTPGQLYAGGTGLARGYLGDPALTAERFIPDPWLPGARLYATGDLARQRSNGTFEFLGRLDDQFKKRGFRVEPGEVEAALRADPAVRDVAVLADGATADTRRLVAVLVPALTAGPAGAEFVAGVRARLRATLPDYLVPDIWAAVPAFPLTAQGKVDRRALLHLATASPLPQEEPIAQIPDTEPDRLSVEESTLVTIWQDILGVDRVDPETDFFALGGHSLLANRMVSQVRKRLDFVLSLDAIFDHPTVRDLATVVQAGRAAGMARAGAGLVNESFAGPGHEPEGT
jgi:amino acid adenylation domain-containing protein